MSSNYEKLKKLYSDDPEMLAMLERKETQELLKELSKDVNMRSALEIARQLKQGDQGEPGYSPVKGKDYFTEEEIGKIARYIKDGLKEEVTPRKGVDYFDGEDGRNADESEMIERLKKLIPTVDEIVARVQVPELPVFDEQAMLLRFLSSIPKQESLTIEEIVKEIKEKKLLELRDIRGARLDTPKSSGQYLHGGGLTTILNAGTLVTNNMISLNFTGTGINSITELNGVVTVDITGGGVAGITSINADVTAAQILDVGTAGTDFAIADNGTGTHTFNLPTASALNRGALSSADWTTFNNKQNAITPAALTKVDDTNVTLTLGGTPNTALLQATSLTLGWAGQLSVARGGTGLSTIAVRSILVANALDTFVALSPGAGQSIRINAGNTAWEAYTPAVGTVTSVSGTADRITSTGGATPVIDIAATYVGQTSITTLGTIATGTWNATNIALGKGGTGASLSDPGANAIFVWDDTTNATRLALLSGLSYDSGTNTLTASGTPVSFGTVGQIPFMNAGGTDFDYSAAISWNGARMLLTGAGTGQVGALHINRGDSVNQYIVLQESGASAGSAYLTFAGSNPGAMAMGALFTAGVPTAYVFTDTGGTPLVTIDEATGNLTMVGSLGLTGTRVSKGWFTDVESTNMYSVGGVSLTTVAQAFQNKTITNSNNVLGGVTMTLGSDADGDIYYRASNVLTRLPKGTAGQVLTMNAGATAPEWATAGGGVPTTITVANEATDISCFIAFFTAATGDLGPKTNVNMTFNSSTGVATFASTILTTTDINGGTIDGTVIGGATPAAVTSTIVVVDNITIDLNTISTGSGNLNLTPVAGSAIVLDGTISVDAGVVTGITSLGVTGTRVTAGFFTDLTVTNAIAGSITGNAATVTVANEATDTTCFIAFFTDASGSLAPKTNVNMTFNSNTGVATFASTVLTTTDINGGTIDGTVIGGSSAAAITGTTIVANTAFNPDADGGAALGSATLGFSILGLASASTINFANSNVVLTHSAGILTMGTGEMRITSAGTNAASVITQASTNTLSNKTLAGAVGNALGAVAMSLGSDADGDIYYRSSGVLTRLAKGTAAQVLKMNAGATAPEWGAASGGNDVQTFTTGTGNWTKPSSGTYVLVQVWGAGGSGGKGSSGDEPGSGGGGGAYVEKLFLIGDLAGTEPYSIGAGGVAQTTASTAGNVGNNSTFGAAATLVTAYGGGGGGLGGSGGARGGGGGGGAQGVGQVGAATQVGGLGGLPAGTSPGGGTGGAAGANGAINTLGGGGGGGASSTTAGFGGSSVYGGGGGGGSDRAGAGTAGAGGASVWGGGGGGGGDSAGAVAGGFSMNGGNGGAGNTGNNAATAGSQPGGGGGGSQNGTSGAGGAGKIVVTTF